MAILCIQTLPPGVTLDQVQAVTKDLIAGGPPAGGISHAVIVDGGQVTIFDVWESEEAMNTFTSERLVPAIQKQMAAEREYRLALLQATDTCKNKEQGCRGGKYGPPSPKQAELPPRYSTANINRVDNPEDRSMSERCMAAVLPDFGGFRRIVQSPGSVSIFYDVGQGQGWQRIIPVDGSPHLPRNIQQRFGDSRARWEGETLVVDVTNFSPKSDFMGSRENRHLTERWTRTGPDTIEYVVTIEDPGTWTKPWTVKQEYSRQNDQANRIYYEPRCHEGNFGMPALLAGGRTADKAFAQGRGPDPATLDNVKGMDAPEENTDPLQ